MMANGSILISISNYDLSRAHPNRAGKSGGSIEGDARKAVCRQVLFSKRLSKVQRGNRRVLQESGVRRCTVSILERSLC